MHGDHQTLHGIGKVCWNDFVEQSKTAVLWLWPQWWMYMVATNFVHTNKWLPGIRGWFEGGERYRDKNSGCDYTAHPVPSARESLFLFLYSTV